MKPGYIDFLQVVTGEIGYSSNRIRRENREEGLLWKLASQIPIRWENREEDDDAFTLVGES